MDHSMDPMEAVTAVLYVVLKYSRVILKYWMIIEKKNEN